MAAPKIMQQGRIVPWLYLLPSFVIIIIFIVYPIFNTISLSFRDRTGNNPAVEECREGEPCWGIFENYRYSITNPEMTTALKNNALWLLVMVPMISACLSANQVTGSIVASNLPQPSRGGYYLGKKVSILSSFASLE